jgi:DHA2 family multidrug resistance protein
MRQVFGSFGTAIFVTLLQARQTFHGTVLAQSATSSNFTLQQTLGQVQQWVLLHGGSAMQAQADGLLLVMQQLQRTAAVQAFDDVFMVAALVTLLALVPALFIGGKAGRSGHAEPSLVLE